MIIPTGLYHARLTDIQPDSYLDGYQRLHFVVDDEEPRKSVYNGTKLTYRVKSDALSRTLIRVFGSDDAIGKHALLDVSVFIPHDGDDEKNYVRSVMPRLYDPSIGIGKGNTYKGDVDDGRNLHDKRRTE